MAGAVLHGFTLVLESVYQNTGLRVNGRSPWRLRCQWEDPSSRKLFFFESDNLWFDPSSLRQPGQEIDVLVDRCDRKRYYVDVDFLTSRVG